MEVYIHTTKDTPRYHSMEPKKAKQYFLARTFLCSQSTSDLPPPSPPSPSAHSPFWIRLAVLLSGVVGLTDDAARPHFV